MWSMMMLREGCRGRWSSPKVALIGGRVWGVGREGRHGVFVVALQEVREFLPVHVVYHVMAAVTGQDRDVLGQRDVTAGRGRGAVEARWRGTTPTTVGGKRKGSGEDAR